MAAPKGTVYKRCGCKHPETGKPLNGRCPDLPKRGHGTYLYDVRIDTTPKLARRLKRGGYRTQTAAEEALDHVRDLVKLAADDDRVRYKIGDWIFTASVRGGQLPSVADVRRRLGVGDDPAAPGVTVGEWLHEWIAGRNDLKRSTRHGYLHHIDKFFVPLLGDISRDKLRVAHIVGMFDRVNEWNDEIREARKEGRPYDLPDDVRRNHHIVSVNTQHRILATLKSAYSDAVGQPGMIDWNPAKAVNLPPPTRDPRRVWGPEEVVIYLDASSSDRLGLVYRIVLLRGPRRGEVLGIRLDDLDDDYGGVTIAHTLLEISGQIVEDTPKTQAGKRWLAFDPDTTDLVKERIRVRRREKFEAGEAWQEHGLLFCREDGTPLRPSDVSEHFQEIAEEADLPVITLHEGRHTAATLALESELDLKIVSESLGHASTGITRDVYTHVRKVVHMKAAAKVAQMLPKAEKKEITT